MNSSSHYQGYEALYLAARGGFALDGKTPPRPMIPARRMPFLLVVLGLVACLASASAQVRVTLKPSKRTYVAHEAVSMTVTLTNHAGRDLLIHSDGSVTREVPWLDFAVKNSKGQTLSPVKRVSFKAVRIPAGQSVAKTVNLSGLYRVSDLGTYTLSAVVRLPGGGGTFRSNGTAFNVTQARVIYRQKVGVPGSRNVREYSVMVFNASEKSSLYVGVKDQHTGRTITTYSLGEALLFHKPTATVDGKNNLHILHLTSPSTFSHSRINPDGKFLGRKLFKRGSTGSPSLQTYPNGDVQVTGGVPYDPEAERLVRAQVRRLSERPSILYR